VLGWAAAIGCASPLDRPALTLTQQTQPVVEVDPAQPIAATGAAGGQSSALAIDALDAQTPEIFATAQQDPQAPTTQATSPSPGDGPGYRTIGGVLAEVNGKPIFSEEVIAASRNELRAAAKQQADRERFLQEARRILAAEIQSRMQNEMLRLVAERNLSRADRQRALFAATEFRVNRISAAGGSEARARQIALRDEGMTLEKLVEDTEHRLLLTLFIQSVILPRAIPSAEEIRDYFQRHPEVSSPQGKGEIEFLLIEISAGEGATPASPEQLRARADHVHGLAAAGEDFEALARQYNDNPSYRQRGGAVPGMPLGRGDFRWPAVDAAVWSTPEGQVTPVISEDNGRKFFIAKVTRRNDPQTIGFAEAQSFIRQQLTNERRTALISQYMAEAEQYAARTSEEQIRLNLQTALEVVAQQYETWRAE
jgi:hypothetical protein